MDPSSHSIIVVALVAAALIFSAFSCFAKAVRVQKGLYSPFRQTDGAQIQGMDRIRSKLSSTYAFQGGALMLTSAPFLGSPNLLLSAAALAGIYAVGTIVRQYLARPVLKSI